MDINIWADLSSLWPAGSVCKLASVGVETAEWIEREWEDRDTHLKTEQAREGQRKIESVGKRKEENVLNFGVRLDIHWHPFSQS